MSSDHLLPETLGAMADGELSPSDEAAAHAHLNECHECSKRVLALYQLRSVVKRAAQSNTPSPQVLARLQAHARQVQKQPVKWTPLRVVALQVAAALLLLALVLGGWRWMRQSDALASEVFDQHLATLSPGSLPEVASSDRHTVKPWFEGKLPFSFNLPEPNALPSDTVLIGADFAYIQGKPAALLLFSIHKHRTSVFVTQGSLATGLPYRRTQSGFQFVSTESKGLELIAISDANTAELEALVRSITAAQ